jgi:hypothetical protein
VDRERLEIVSGAVQDLDWAVVGQPMPGKGLVHLRFRPVA